MKYNLIDRTAFLFEYKNYITEAEDDLTSPPTGEEDQLSDDITNTEGDVEAPLDMSEETPTQEAESDVEELDITQLVEKQTDVINKLDELFGSLNNMSEKMEAISKKVGEEMTKVSEFFNQNLGEKISNLEKTVTTRNPTPDEKLSLKSLDSYPYNVKVSTYFEDYAKNKEAARDNILNQDKQPPITEPTTPKEYVITKKEIQGFSDYDIKNSF